MANGLNNDQKTDKLNTLHRNLASNVISLRKLRGFTQAALATTAQIPRSTVTYLESGQGNPTLQNLARLAAALQVSIEELIAPPRGRCQLVNGQQITPLRRGQGSVLVYQLLPDPILGMNMDRMEFEMGGRMGGVPHLNGTKEYLSCLQGEVTVRTSGQIFRVRKGDVLAFPGDQPHSYENTGGVKAICLSVVVLAPAGV